jgi:hypothetical protein
MGEKMAVADIFSPKWKDPDWTVRKAAVEKLNKPKKLGWIAINDPHDEVVKAAVARIEDQKILEEIAENEKNEEIRKMAIEKVKNQDLLAKTAEKDKSPDIRLFAVKALESQEILLSIAKESHGDLEIRKVAVERLRKKWMLSECTKSARDEVIRKIADRKLKELSNAFYMLYPDEADEKNRLIASYEDMLRNLEELWIKKDDEFDSLADILIKSPAFLLGAADKFVDLLAYSDQFKVPFRLELLRRAKSFMLENNGFLFRPWEERFEYLGVDPKNL